MTMFAFLHSEGSIGPWTTWANELWMKHAPEEV